VLLYTSGRASNTGASEGCFCPHHVGLRVPAGVAFSKPSSAWFTHPCHFFIFRQKLNMKHQLQRHPPSKRPTAQTNCKSLSMYTSSACSFSRRPRNPASAAVPLPLYQIDGVGQTVLVRRCWSASWGYRQSKFNDGPAGRTPDALYPHLNALWGDDRTPFLSKAKAPGKRPAPPDRSTRPIQLKAEQPWFQRPKQRPD
jgi:hypothetical protein